MLISNKIPFSNFSIFYCFSKTHSPSFDQRIKAYVPHDKVWIKQRVFKYLQKQASLNEQYNKEQYNQPQYNQQYNQQYNNQQQYRQQQRY
jgi:hypothetical protein